MSRPNCTCRGSICRNARGEQVVRLFRCAGCARLVPWCLGSSDDMPDHCDDCWSAAHEAARKALERIRVDARTAGVRP